MEKVLAVVAVVAVIGWAVYSFNNVTPTQAASDAAEAGSGSKIDGGEAGSGSKIDGDVKVRPLSKDGGLADIVTQPAVTLSDEAWAERLSEEQYHILREHGTERAFTGSLLENKSDGYYICAGCNLPLFEDDTKFDSGTGWPSFYAPAAQENVAERRDTKFGMVRTEVLCTRCGGHLGHVFNDGPQPTGLRYCINSDALLFADHDKAKALAEEEAKMAKAETEDNSAFSDKEMDKWLPAPEKDVPLAEESGEAKVVLAGGCFWCTEGVFQQVPGVKSVVSGYAGGDPKQADYKSVTTGTTGHAEAIEITYDPSVQTYGKLLRIFMITHDPTTLNRQGADTGTQYRSAVFYKNDEEKAIAEAYFKQIDASGKLDNPVVTTLEPLEEFFVAEDYHQDYVDHNPNNRYIKLVADPKIEKAKKFLQDLGEI